MPTKVRLVKAMVFPVVMYGCESWTVKKAEHQRYDVFELWVLEKTLESPLDCKEIHKIIILSICPVLALTKRQCSGSPWEGDLAGCWPGEAPPTSPPLLAEKQLETASEWGP